MNKSNTVRLFMAALVAGALPCLVCGVLPRPAAAQQTVAVTHRYALVIGNAHYDVPANVLANPARDANLVSAALRKQGFDVTTLTDLDTVQMRGAVNDFAARAAHADMALVYYAGHAVAVDGTNYLFGVDLSVPLSQVTLGITQQSALSLKLIQMALNRAQIGARLIVLDSCRTPPVRGAAPATLAPAVLEKAYKGGGELIAYSTQPGASANDGFGLNGPKDSPYSYYFAQDLDLQKRDEPITEFFQRVTGDVQTATLSSQIPSYESNLRGKVTLASLTGGTVLMASAAGDGGQVGRGAKPDLGNDLIKSRLSDWEYEIERGATYLDVPGLKALQARARVGDVIAMTTLGLANEQGVDGVVKKNPQAAVQWYRKAAAKNFPIAETYLGESAADGMGMPKNYALAEQLLGEAAQAGHRRAAMDLQDVRMRRGENLDPNDLMNAMKGEFQDVMQQSTRNPFATGKQ